MKREEVIEARGALPLRKHRSDGAGGQAPTVPRDEERARAARAHLQVLLELVVRRIGERHALRARIALPSASLEDPQLQRAAWLDAVGGDVLDVQGDDLALPEGGAEREGENEMVAKTVHVSARDFQHLRDLVVGQRARRASIPGRVSPPFYSRPRDPIPA